jgi:hypothetical protein
LPAATAISTAGQTGLEQIAGCLSSKSDLQALLVVDESGSLKGSDPNNQRAPILADVLTSLGNLSTQKLTTQQRRVDVAVSTFAVGYSPWIDWTTLNPARASELAKKVRNEIPKRNDGNGTNHPAALAGARQTLAQGASRFGNEDPPCKILLFFTDGQLDISDDDSVDDAAAIKVCEPKGTVSGLRNDSVNIVTIFLSSPTAPDQAGLAKGSKFLRGISEGNGGGTPPTCGVYPLPETASQGVFLEGSADALSSLFGTVVAVGSGGTQISGLKGSPVSLRVDKGVSSFRVIAPASQGLSLTSPSGAVLNVQSGGGGGAVGDTTAEVSWVGSSATISVPITTQTGNWVLTRQGESKEFSFFLFSGVQIALDDGKLVVDQPATITGRIVDQNSQTADLSVYSSAQIKGENVQSDGTKAPIALVLNQDGTFTGTFTPTSTSTQITFNIDLSLVTKNIDNGGPGQQLANVVRTFVQPVRLAEVFPTIDPATLTLSALNGKKGVAQGAISVKGSPQGDSQICLGKTSFVGLDDPEALVVTGDNGCVPVAANEAKTIAIEVRNAKSAFSGQVQGAIPLEITSAGSAAVPAIKRNQEIPVTFVSLIPIDEPLRWQLFLFLVVVGLLLPLLILDRTNRANARFLLEDQRQAIIDFTAKVRNDQVTVSRVVSDPDVTRAQSFADEDDFDPVPSRVKKERPRLWLHPVGASLLAVRPKFLWPFGKIGAKATPSSPGRWVMTNCIPAIGPQGDGAEAGFELEPSKTFVAVIGSTPMDMGNERIYTGQVVMFIPRSLEQEDESDQKIKDFGLSVSQGIASSVALLDGSRQTAAALAPVVAEETATPAQTSSINSSQSAAADTSDSPSAQSGGGDEGDFESKSIWDED